MSNQDSADTQSLPKLPDIGDLQGLLRFESEEGRIWLAEERMILLRSSEMRALRREMIETLGRERAKGLLMRMGYIAGQKDADTAKSLRPNQTPFEVFSVGPQSHMVTGQVKVTPVSLDLNEEGHFHGVFDWENSFEADVFLAEYGLSPDPVCWAQVGYATGYTSRFLGQQILYREVSCVGCGDSICRIEGRPADDWPDADELSRYYDADRIADQLRELQSQVISLRDSLGEVKGFRALVGSSEGFLRVRELLVKAASSKVTVLLLGETGVGKDVFAKALHKASPRCEKPFVAFNCAAIPKDLVEAELFGVKKGAYTGADQSRPGRFERADGGTLFLDEVGDLSPQAQVALLRVLQEGELERVGGTHTRKVDVRVVAATNKDLDEAVRQGLFRADLLYRLNVYTVTVPPLRERLDDLPDFVRHFIDKYSAMHGEKVSGISDKALAMLRAYDWPGNIRELANMIERGVILAGKGGTIDAAHLFPNLVSAQHSRVAEPSPSDPAASASAVAIADALIEKGYGLERLERALMERALDHASGNVTRAAKLLGLSRATLDYRLKKAGIAPGDHKGQP